MDYTIITKHSEIITLLKVFQDKKSGKVIESRNILRDSFYFLRRKDMLLVLKAFLNGSKTDMDWVSLRMQRPDWRKEFSPVLYLDFLLKRANVELIIQTMRDLNMKKEMEILWEWKEKMIDSFQCYSSFEDIECFCKYIVTKVRENFPPQFSYMLPKREKAATDGNQQKE